MHYKQTSTWAYDGGGGADSSEDAPNILPGLPHPTRSRRVLKKNPETDLTKCTENPRCVLETP